MFNQKTNKSKNYENLSKITEKNQNKEKSIIKFYKNDYFVEVVDGNILTVYNLKKDHTYFKKEFQQEIL